MLRDRRPVAAPRRPDDALQALLDLLEIGVDELGLDRLDVPRRVDGALGVEDVLVVVGATTWTIASVSRMFPRNWLPSPSPSLAPRTRPAMSWKAMVSATISEAPIISETSVSRGSSTGTIAMFGSIVVNG